MPKRITWNETGERIFETGVRQGVLYLKDELGKYVKGVAWNGLTAVTESPSGAEPTPLWADDTKYLTLMSVEEFGATIEAYMYPDEFMLCDGSAEIAPGVYIGQQNRAIFGLAYRTVKGNDVELNEYGYKLHLVYGALASPSDKAYSSINDSPDAITFSWEISTTPIDIDEPYAGFRPTSVVTMDSTKVDATKLKALENILYGSATAEPRLPLPDEIKTLMAAS